MRDDEKDHLTALAEACIDPNAGHQVMMRLLKLSSILLRESPSLYLLEENVNIIYSSNLINFIVDILTSGPVHAYICIRVLNLLSVHKSFIQDAYNTDLAPLVMSLLRFSTDPLLSIEITQWLSTCSPVILQLFADKKSGHLKIVRLLVRQMSECKIMKLRECMIQTIFTLVKHDPRQLYFLLNIVDTWYKEQTIDDSNEYISLLKELNELLHGNYKILITKEPRKKLRIRYHSNR